MGNGTALLVAILLPIPLSPFPISLPDRPPLAHTGGFGEATDVADDTLGGVFDAG